MATKEESLGQRVGQTLARLRREKGMTQDALAEAASIERESVSRIERGAMVPSLQRLEVMADVLGVSLAELLRTSSPRPVDQSDEIIELLQGLSEENRLWVKQWVVEMCKKLPGSGKPRKR